MLTRDIFTRRPLTSLTMIDPSPVIGLAISPFEDDLAFLRHIFDDGDWKLFTAHTCREAKAELRRDRLAVVICESHLIDGNWKDMIRKTAASDHGELALARNLRAKLGPGKPTEHRRKNIAKKPARRRVARIDDEVRPPQEFPQ